jgi:hypothetical protein
MQLRETEDQSERELDPGQIIKLVPSSTSAARNAHADAYAQCLSKSVRAMRYGHGAVGSVSRPDTFSMTFTLEFHAGHEYALPMLESSIFAFMQTPRLHDTGGQVRRHDALRW